MAFLSLNVNGKPQTVDVTPRERLLYVLRDNLGLHGPKFGCGLGQCGACTVLVDGEPLRSCIIPASYAAGHSVTTLEGLGTIEHPHEIQKAFIEEQAAQCGYCIGGMMMAATALLNKNLHPSEQEIRTALAGNLCGCGTHLRILRAIKRAASQMALR